MSRNLGRISKKKKKNKDNYDWSLVWPIIWFLFTYTKRTNRVLKNIFIKVIYVKHQITKNNKIFHSLPFTLSKGFSISQIKKI